MLVRDKRVYQIFKQLQLSVESSLLLFRWLAQPPLTHNGVAGSSSFARQC